MADLPPNNGEDLFLVYQNMIVPRTLTPSLFRFRVALDDSIAFLVFILEAGVFIQRHWDQFLKTSERLSGNSEQYKYFRSIFDEPKFRQQMSLESHDHYMSKLALANSVDSFLVYLREILTEVFLAKPETLKTSAEVRVDWVLEHKSMGELVAAIAAKRIERLTFEGSLALITHFSKLGVPLTTTDHQLKQLSLLIESRNVIVHNRGFINEIFLRRIPDHPGKVGDAIQLSFDDTSKARWFLNNLVCVFDRRVSKKFNLHAHESKTEGPGTWRNVSEII